MNELKNILEQNLNDNFISAVLSNPRDEKLSAKVKVRPVLMKDTRVYQMETFRGNQAFHENLSADEACEKMLEAMENMKQMQLVTADAEFSVLISKKGKVTIKKKQKKAKMRPLDLNHNRKKQYILQEGVPVPFLQDLGVMTEEGKIVHAGSTSSGRSTGSWNLSRIFYHSLILEESLQFWILAVESLILHLLCIIIFMS